MTGRELLQQWIDRSNFKTQGQAAKALDMSEPDLCRTLKGQRRPKLERLSRIEALTGIPVSSWVDKSRGKTDRRRKPLARTA